MRTEPEQANRAAVAAGDQKGRDAVRASAQTLVQGSVGEGKDNLGRSGPDGVRSSTQILLNNKQTQKNQTDI